MQVMVQVMEECTSNSSPKKIPVQKKALEAGIVGLCLIRADGNLPSFNRVKCLASLTPPCLSLLCSHGLQVNSFWLVLHIDMLIIRGILLVAWVLQKQPLTRKYLSDTIRKYIKSNDYLSKFYGNLLTKLTGMGIDRLRTKRFHNLSQTTTGAQIICNCQSPPAPPTVIGCRAL